MTLRLINAVGTRTVREGEHALLMRWYADHVHQLMAFDGLFGAVLHQCATHDPLSTAPPYLCLYEFADRAAFDAYEQSDVHAGAAHDRGLGWGRDGIQIVWRAQFERLYARHAGRAPATLHVQAWALHPPAEPPPLPATLERALAAQAGLASITLLRASPQRQAAAAARASTPAQANATTPAQAPTRPTDVNYLTLNSSASTPPAPPGLTLHWHAPYQPLLRWHR
jgi:heme-degrading monooxygenase HmoA